MKTKRNLKSSTAPAPEFKADATPGLVADPKKEGIPTFLQTQNRDKVFPINAEVKAKLEAQAVVQSKVRPFEQPKGMSDEEWEAKKNRERLEAESKKQREPKPPKPAKAEAPKDTFTLRQLARDNQIDPRVARAIARANAAFFKPLWAGGFKHTFLNGDKQRVLDVIKQGLDKKPAGDKKAATTKKAKKTKIPPGAVFTGKAKVKRTNVAPPTNVKGPKAKAREEIAALMKNKKKQVTKREADINAKARVEVPAASKKERDGGKPAPRVASKKK